MYGFEIRLRLGDGQEWSDEPVNEIQVHGVSHAVLQPANRLSDGKPVGGRRFVLTGRSYQSASDAERHGMRVVHGILWSSVVKRCPLRLEYENALPVTVFPVGTGRLRAFGEAHAIATTPRKLLLDDVNQFVQSGSDVDASLQLALELFVAAPLEGSLRSRFVAMVSALEPLIHPAQYSDTAILSIIDEAMQRIGSTQTLDGPARDSLVERLRGLKRESISAALKRMLRIHIADDQQAQAALARAYSVRSKLLHEGARLDEPATYLHEVESSMRKLFARLLGLEFAA